MRTIILWSLIGILNLSAGCVYYEEFRQRKADADMRQETADLMKQYRLCMEKYENDPMKAKEYCSAYGDALRQVHPKRVGPM